MRIQAEKLASLTPNLSIRANKLANTVLEGIHNRNKAGIGDNFWQFRKYEYGDPIQLIDWKKTGKSSDIFIQEKELSTVQNINIWRDTSNSMNYHSNKNIILKSDIANILTLALSLIFSKKGENVSINGINNKSITEDNNLEPITDTLNNKTTTRYVSKPNLNEIKNNSSSILIGDFLYNSKITNNIIKTLSSRNIYGIIIHIIDPAEKSFPFKGRINFNGLEGEDPYLIGNVEAVKEEYSKIFEDHIKNIKNTAKSYGWNYFMHITDKPLEELMIDIYFSISRYDEANIEK